MSTRAATEEPDGIRRLIERYGDARADSIGAMEMGTTAEVEEHGHTADRLLAQITTTFAESIPDDEAIRGILALWAFADDRDVDGTTIYARDRVRRYLEKLPEEMQP